MKTLLAALLLLPSLAFAQATTAPASTPAPLKVSVDSRGDDVREVIATLFAQAHKPYALDASIKGKLYVTLDQMPFAKALDVVLLQAGLVSKEKDGVILISPAPKPVVAPKPVAAPTPVAVSAPAPVKKPAFDKADLNHRVTTRLTRAALADVFAQLSEQSNVPIELDAAVPGYKVDAFFIKTSLRYALDRVCKAANLRYEITEEKVVVKVK